MKKLLILVCFIFTSYIFYAQAPQGYYDSANNLNGQALKIALHNIIKNHNVISYSSLFSVFSSTDNKGNNVVWDIYSDNPFGNPPYVYYYTNPSDQCGQYSSEGDCYNKEHSWPHSWFGSTSIPIYSDLFHVYPTDGWVNNKRANFPYGKVNNPTWTSQNGSKLGPCSSPGYSSTVFEPINEYKGDIARSYFYITVRYFGEDAGWTGSPQTEGAELKPWGYNLMYSWHIQDPVSQKETDRNDAIYQLQNNRNPFIDNPNWVDSLLFPVGISNNLFFRNTVSIFPNPTSDFINISTFLPLNKIVMYNVLGKEILSVDNISNDTYTLDLNAFEKGYYLLNLFSGNQLFTEKVLVK